MSADVGDPMVVTTSWDDGDPLDLRLAEMMAAVGVAGTFYVPIHREGLPVMTPAQLQELRSLGMEIGGHTVNHVEVTRLSLPDLRRELSESKDRLEQILQEQVTSFCYPKGLFSVAAAAMVAECGYEVARTTVAFRTGTRFDPYRMPVTFQVFPHTRRVHVRHALKERNVAGLMAWVARMGGAVSLPLLTARAFDRVQTEGGVLHFWGHSWELEKKGLWELIGSLIERLAGHEDVKYLTNGELVRLLGSHSRSTAKRPQPGSEAEKRSPRMETP